MIKECIFCKIIKKQSPAYIIYENAEICCFLDHDPINEGHTLLVPKKHLLGIDECSIDLKNSLMECATLITRALKSAYAPDGISMMQNSGFFDEIGHYHMHIFPRYKDDGFGWKVATSIKTTPKLQQQRQELLLRVLDNI